MKGINLCNLTYYSNQHEIVANFFVKMLIAVCVVPISYLLCKFTFLPTSRFFISALLGIYCCICLYTEIDLPNILFYNQLLIKRQTIKFYGFIQFAFSYANILVIAFIIGMKLNGFFSLMYMAVIIWFLYLVLILFSILRKKKQYIFIIGLICTFVVSGYFFYFYQPLYETMIYLVLINSILLIVAWILFDCLLYGSIHRTIFTLERGLSFKNQFFRFLTFEFLFLFRLKKKKIIFSIVCSLVAFILFSTVMIFKKLNADFYLTISDISASLWPSGIFTIMYGSYTSIWMVYYLNDVFTKHFSLKIILLSKIVFLTIYAVIMSIITLPILYKLNIMSIEYCNGCIYNIFIAPLLATYLGVFTVKKHHFNIDPAKYQETEPINALIQGLFMHGFGIAYYMLTSIFSKSDILIFILTIALISILLYPKIIQTCERIILKKRRQYESNSNRN